MDKAEPIRVMVVEDDELFRLGLVTRLRQEGLTVVAEAEDGETAVEITNRYPLDVVLLDVGLPGIGGIEACRQMKQLHPQLPILVLTSHSQASLISRLIAAGAQGYCLKGVSADVLILALRSLAMGASWWDTTATSKIRSLIHSEPAPEPSTSISPPSPLTKREQEILVLLAQGKTNQEIAQQLYITPGTVRVHVHAILQKLEVRDRTQAAIVALQNQWITQGEPEDPF